MAASRRRAQRRAAATATLSVILSANLSSSVRRLTHSSVAYLYLCVNVHTHSSAGCLRWRRQGSAGRAASAVSSAGACGCRCSTRILARPSCRTRHQARRAGSLQCSLPWARGLWGLCRGSELRVLPCTAQFIGRSFNQVFSKILRNLYIRDSLKSARNFTGTVIQSHSTLSRNTSTKNTRGRSPILANPGDWALMVVR